MGEGSVVGYFGLYCPQCNAWLKNSEGRFVYYPAPELVSAMLTENDPVNAGLRESHAWQAQEFGKEQAVNPDDLPAGMALCPSIVARLNQERYWREVNKRFREDGLTF